MDCELITAGPTFSALLKIPGLAVSRHNEKYQIDCAVYLEIVHNMYFHEKPINCRIYGIVENSSHANLLSLITIYFNILFFLQRIYCLLANIKAVEMNTTIIKVCEFRGNIPVYFTVRSFIAFYSSI